MLSVKIINISKLLWSLSDIALVDGISRPPGGVLGIVFN